MDYILLTNYAFVVCGAVEEGMQSNNVFSEISLWQWLCVSVLNFERCMFCSRVTIFANFVTAMFMCVLCCVLQDIVSHHIPWHCIARQYYALHSRGVQFIALH